MLVMCVAGCVGRRVNNIGIGKLKCTDAGHSYLFSLHGEEWHA